MANRHPKHFNWTRRQQWKNGWANFLDLPFLRRETQKGFPDDREAFGPTITSEASLREIQNWFPELTLESLRRRFRTNLELIGGEPFCEDRFFGAPGELKPFQIGAVKFFGHNPCQRCVVPTRDPDSGQAVTEFSKEIHGTAQKISARMVERAALQSFLPVCRQHFYSAQTKRENQLRVGDA